ncbi:MAG: hypothetical protein CMJ58_02250 [Planctomycetaceae bacterium]|nr:hypothetical protein [Planctomycetaceae bacterium]
MVAGDGGLASSCSADQLLALSDSAAPNIVASRNTATVGPRSASSRDNPRFLTEAMRLRGNATRREGVFSGSSFLAGRVAWH